MGIHITDGTDDRFVQLIGEDITTDNIMAALAGVDIIYTYNGSRFDLPFIHYCFGVNLAKLFQHRDLMYVCWRNNLYGGFKAVEQQLGIERQLKEVNGYEAVRLWWKYTNDYDEDALTTLLAYNKEDVVNLKALKERIL